MRKKYSGFFLLLSTIILGISSCVRPLSHQNLNQIEKSKTEILQQNRTPEGIILDPTEDRQGTFSTSIPKEGITPTKTNVENIESNGFKNTSVSKQNKMEKGKISDIDFSPDGSLVLIDSEGGFSLYGAINLSPIWYFEEDFPFTTARTGTHARFIENGSKIISNGNLNYQEYFYITNTSDGKLIETIPIGINISFFDVFPDGENVIIETGNGEYELFNVKSHIEHKIEEKTRCAVDYFTKMPGNKVATSACTQINVWDTEGNTTCSFAYKTILEDDQYKGDINGIASLHDNLIIVLRELQINILDVCEKKIVNSMDIYDYGGAKKLGVSEVAGDFTICFGNGSYSNIKDAKQPSINTINLMNISNFGNIYKNIKLPFPLERLVNYPRADRFLVVDEDTGSLLLLNMDGEIVSHDSGFTDRE